MKALKVDFDKKMAKIVTAEGVTEEDWIDVCERFDNDVHRIREFADKPPYTALYSCYDEDNQPSYFLVEEDRQLDKMRHKVFLNKLGRN